MFKARLPLMFFFFAWVLSAARADVLSPHELEDLLASDHPGDLSRQIGEMERVAKTELVEIPADAAGLNRYYAYAGVLFDAVSSDNVEVSSRALYFLARYLRADEIPTAKRRESLTAAEEEMLSMGRAISIDLDHARSPYLTFAFYTLIQRQPEKIFRAVFEQLPSTTVLSAGRALEARRLFRAAAARALALHAVRHPGKYSHLLYRMLHDPAEGVRNAAVAAHRPTGEGQSAMLDEGTLTRMVVDTELSDLLPSVRASVLIALGNYFWTPEGLRSPGENLSYDTALHAMLETIEQPFEVTAVRVAASQAVLLSRPSRQYEDIEESLISPLAYSDSEAFAQNLAEIFRRMNQVGLDTKHELVELLRRDTPLSAKRAIVTILATQRRPSSLSLYASLVETLVDFAQRGRAGGGASAAYAELKEDLFVRVILPFIETPVVVTPRFRGESPDAALKLFVRERESADVLIRRAAVIGFGLVGQIDESDEPLVARAMQPRADDPAELTAELAETSHRILRARRRARALVGVTAPVGVTEMAPAPRAAVESEASAEAEIAFEAAEEPADVPVLLEPVPEAAPEQTARPARSRMETVPAPVGLKPWATFGFGLNRSAVVENQFSPVLKGQLNALARLRPENFPPESSLDREGIRAQKALFAEARASLRKLEAQPPRDWLFFLAAQEILAEMDERILGVLDVDVRPTCNSTILRDLEGRLVRITTKIARVHSAGLNAGLLTNYFEPSRVRPANIRRRLVKIFTAALDARRSATALVAAQGLKLTFVSFPPTTFGGTELPALAETLDGQGVPFGPYDARARAAIREVSEVVAGFLAPPEPRVTVPSANDPAIRTIVERRKSWAERRALVNAMLARPAAYALQTPELLMAMADIVANDRLAVGFRTEAALVILHAAEYLRAAGKDRLPLFNYVSEKIIFGQREPLVEKIVKLIFAVVTENERWPLSRAIREGGRIVCSAAVAGGN